MWNTDWSKCALSQTDTDKSLSSQPKSFQLTNSGYETLATNIPLFHKLNEMLIAIDIHRLDDGSGIDSAFVKGEAKYHVMSD